MSQEIEVKALLNRAYEHDEEARALRREAGRELAKLRSENPLTWHKSAGIDRRGGELLIEMAHGREVDKA